ncbi:unnamed protein product, partial [Prorocentrum cordatum]
VGALALYSVCLETGVGFSGSPATLRALSELGILAGFGGFAVPGRPSRAGRQRHKRLCACEGPAVHPEHLVPARDLVEMRPKGAGDLPIVRVAKQPPHLPATRPVEPLAASPDGGDASRAVRAALAEADGLALTLEARQELVDDAHAASLRTARLDFGGVVDAVGAALARWGGRVRRPAPLRGAGHGQRPAFQGQLRHEMAGGGQLGYIAGMLETVLAWHWWEELPLRACDAIGDELGGMRGSAQGLLDNVANFAP